MPFGKQGGKAPAPVYSNKVGKKPGGKVVGGGMVKKPMNVKSVGGNAKKSPK